MTSVFATPFKNRCEKRKPMQGDFSMKEYKSKRTNSIDKRVRKVHRKAKTVGFLYLLGTVLLLATTMILPVLKIDGAEFGISNFYLPLTKLLSGGDVGAMIASVLYGLLLFVLLVNLFRSLSKLGWLTKRSYRYANGYNRNMRAMSDMGKAFSSSLAAIVMLYLQAYLLQQPSNVEFVALNAYIILGIGLFIHFVAGLKSGKVSRFYVGETGMVEEEKRTCGLFAYFFRNLVQIAATAAIVYFLSANNQLYTISAIVADLMKGSLDMNSLIVVGLQALTLVFLFVLIKHSTAATEFNLFGIEGRGMLNFRVFAFFTMITGAGLLVWEFVSGNAFDLNYAILTAVAFVAFLIDCIVKSRPKDDEAVSDTQAANMPNAPYPAPMQGKQNIYLQLPAQQGGAQMPQTAYQPIYVPVYYPYPQPMQQPQVHHVHTPIPVPVYYPQQPVQAPVQYPVQAPAVQPEAAAPATFTRPEPAPAPDYLKPTPSPMAAKEESGLVAPSEGVKTKKALHEERRELSARKAELKREKQQSKRAAKMAKKNQKADAKTAKMAAEIAARREAINNSAASVGAIGTSAAVTALATNALENNENVTPERVETPVMPVVAPVATASENQVQPTVEEEKHFDGEVNELPATLNPKKDWKVRCPRCGKELNIKDSTPYHRCPSCSKIFTIRKFEAYSKKEPSEAANGND